MLGSVKLGITISMYGLREKKIAVLRIIIGRASMYSMLGEMEIAPARDERRNPGRHLKIREPVEGEVHLCRRSRGNL